MSEALPWIGAILTGLSLLIGAILGVPAYRAKVRADRTAERVTEVQTSLAALEAALERGDKEREQTAADRDDLRRRLDIEEALTRQLRDDLRSIRSEMMQQLRDAHAECERTIMRLTTQIHALGGTPDTGEHHE